MKGTEEREKLRVYRFSNVENTFVVTEIEAVTRYLPNYPNVQIQAVEGEKTISIPHDQVQDFLAYARRINWLHGEIKQESKKVLHDQELPQSAANYLRHLQ